MQTLQINATLQSGKYTIKKVLGQGGFGITYLAEHNLLGTKVAIKEFFMKELNNRDESTSQVSVGSEGSRELVMKFRDKFIKEARNIASLNHPNIIRIHDVFEENGTAYYVMEYCEGESLNELLKMHPAGLGEALAVKYIRQVASALQYIHERKMNHLDVKPANIMLNAGNAVLIDFGLSKQYDSTGSQTSTTPVGISHGFAPIEQYKEGGVGDFSPQTDIYALGATLYKLITGQTPVQATDLVVEEWIPAYPSEISANTRKAISKAMEIRKQKRPASVGDFLNILDGNENASNEHAASTDEEATQVMTVLTKKTDTQQDKEDKKNLVEQTESKDANNGSSHQEDVSPNSLSPQKGKKVKGCLKSIAIILSILAILIIGFVVWVISGSNNNTMPDFKVASTPSGASVCVDGLYMGETPLTIKLQPGLHDILVQKEGYQDKEYTHTQTVGGLNSIGFSLDKISEKKQNKQTTKKTKSSEPKDHLTTNQNDPVFSEISSAYNAREWEKVVSLCEGIVAKGGSLGAFTTFYAEALSGCGQHDKALKMLSDSLQSYPNDYYIIQTMGNICCVKGDYSMAHKYFNDVISINANYARPYIYNAEIYVLEGNIEQAVKSYSDATILFYENGAYNECIIYSKKILEIAENHPVGYIFLALAYNKKGNLELFEDYKNKAIEHGGKDVLSIIEDYLSQ